MSANGPSIDVHCVDDEPGVADLTGTFLERFHDRLSVTITMNGGDAVEYLNEDPVDCIVSDYDIPDMVGLEFLEVVRAISPCLPFILFTGLDSSAEASGALTVNEVDLITPLRRERDRVFVPVNLLLDGIHNIRGQRDRWRHLTAV